MPLDGHSYLVSQGWGGKGTGLREGAISRPLAIAQKKNLAGLGKDRDEAFPFWDHLFSAAAKSIVVKCLSDDEDATESSSSNEITIKRTSTGILSNRRPLEGTPATSGAATPNNSSTNSGLSLMATAKRDAARRGLYSRFFKGPILGPESIAEEEKRLAALVSEAFAKQGSGVDSVKVTEHIEIQTATERVSVDLEVSKSSHKKRKTKFSEDSDGDDESEAARRERKRQKREEKTTRKAGKGSKKETNDIVDKKKAKKSRSENKRSQPKAEEPGPSHPTHRPDEADSEKESKAERKCRKEEKKRLKALRKEETDTTTHHVDITQEEKPHRSKSKSKDKKEKKSVDQPSGIKTEGTATESGEKRKKRKRKRKRTNDDDED